jgi:threonylcarbamoyladenosine tRNA methylthiotransferase MtaB
MRMRFFITTLGCKVNQYESASLDTTCRRAGLERADDAGAASLVIINTCCITTTAMRKSRQTIRKVYRQARSNDPVIVVAGCYSDYDGARIAEMLAELDIPAERTIVAGHHGDLADAIGQAIEAATTGRAVSCPAPDASAATLRQRRNQIAAQPPAGELTSIDSFAGHQRAFVKIQDGCDAFCTYCVVPFTRPRLTSRPPDEILDECRQLIDAGHREIVLTGVFIGAFGRPSARRKTWDDTPHKALADIVDKICNLNGLWKLRLSSIEPADVTDDLLAVARSHETFAPHFHLPLQSGSDRILRKMNRQYTISEFKHTVERLRASFDRPALTADIIVGFADETDEDFSQTLEIAEFTRFSKIHAFPFSPIEGTAAYHWRKQIPPDEVVKARMKTLETIEKRLSEAYFEQFVGETLEGLIETDRSRPDQRLQAMTDRYMTILFDSGKKTPENAPKIAPGQVRNFEITATTTDGLAGKLVTQAALGNDVAS